MFPICPQVDRHLRKLDQELAKFKMELEADNAGITEILERRKWLFDPSLQCPTSCRVPDFLSCGYAQDLWRWTARPSQSTTTTSTRTWPQRVSPPSL